jgi:hypothetical protein
MSIANNKHLTIRNFYLFGLILMVIGLPLSTFLMSVSQFVLAIHWFASAQFAQKWQNVKNNKALLVFWLIYLVHLVGMLYSTDWNYGLHDLRIKLPLLILPLIIASNEALSKKEMEIVLGFFSAAVLIASLVSLFVFMGFSARVVESGRDISIFTSHIRFSLMIVFSAFILITYALKVKLNNSFKLILYLLALWLLGFLFILESITGIVIAFIIAFLYLISVSFNKKAIKLKIISLGLISALIIYSISIFYEQYSLFYPRPQIVEENLPTHSISGEKYYHNTERTELENRNYVWSYIAWGELEKSWNKRSNLPYKGLDGKNQPLHSTLIRYMASKGLSKDSVGMLSMNPQDIAAVENGITNYRFIDGRNIKSRIYETLWEYENYRQRGNPQGNSTLQRLEFWKTGWHIFKTSPLIGVGTGDVKSSFKKTYELLGSQLEEKYRLRAHNQYLTFLISFGFFGFLLISFALIYPILLTQAFNNKLFLLFISIALLSMLNEDTLETQAGISFVSFFYSLFVFGYSTKNNTQKA